MFDISEYQALPHFTFENFVVGNSNRFAFAACKSLAQALGSVYNPILIHGGVGLGKTHLLCAIGNYVRQQNPAAVVIYISIERLTKELIESVQSGKLADFNTHFRNADCILIDDVGFLTEKESVQLEIVHFFDALLARQKQIALTSDRPPRELSTLLDRLRSRIEGGLIVDIQIPEFETRVAILQRKVESENIEHISEEVIYAIADRFKTNIRELEGAFNKIVAYTSILKQQVTINQLPDLFRDLYGDGHDPADLTSDKVGIPKPRSVSTEDDREDELPNGIPTSDLSSFLEDMTQGVTQSIAKKEEEMAEKEKFRRKLYIWKMKQFNTTRLEHVINQDLDTIREEFDKYTQDVSKLMQLQKGVACLDNTDGFLDEVNKIEELLFDPDLIDEIEERLAILNYKIQQRFEYANTLQRDFNIRDFIVSDSNRLTFSMAESIIDHPAERFNPLFIHGGKECGKSFLLHAIGNEIFHKHAPMNVLYVNANRFISHLIQAIKDGEVEEFTTYYRQVDFLLFDDIHLLRGKERTQEEFFHIYNHLIGEKKQIVITADRPPQYLLTFDDRLRSRFKSGLVVELGPLDEEAKKTAIIRLFKRCHLTITDDLVNEIVTHISSNVKEISNLLEQTLVQSSTSGQDVTEAMIRKLIQDFEKDKNSKEVPLQASTPVRLIKMSEEEINQKLIQDWPKKNDLIEWEY